MKDIVITWPKSRPLGQYLMALEEALQRAEVINFRVANKPRVEPERCYVVYDGAIRGWNEVLGVEWHGEGQVRDPHQGSYWSAGWYIVRDPEWHPLRVELPYRGFQGYRYIERL